MCYYATHICFGAVARIEPEVKPLQRDHRLRTKDEQGQLFNLMMAIINYKIMGGKFPNNILEIESKKTS